MIDVGAYQSATMPTKLKVIPLPDLDGLSVLDVGCDHGAWCWLAAERGASRVLGLDRGRDGVNLAARNTSVNPFREVEFREVEIGRQWHEYDRFDVVMMLNSYHHIFELCGDHRAVWFWLWRHGSTVLWESPLDASDPVIGMNVTRPYLREEILAAADEWFHVEHIGPGHVPTRTVLRCTPKPWLEPYKIELHSGAGGATKAFLHASSRRIEEFNRILGIRPIPGSLNVTTDRPFHWDRGYYRAQMLDVTDRSQGMDSPWSPRWARIYPLRDCWAFRFEGERYPDNFVELISDHTLRGKIRDFLD